MFGLIASGHTFAVEEIEFPFQKHYDIYAVSGSTADEIEHSFNNDRPQHLIEKDFDGYTAWDYFWNSRARSTKHPVYVASNRRIKEFSSNLE